MSKRPNHLDELCKLARNWPRPGELVFFIDNDEMWLHKIRLPPYARNGEGTKRLAHVLSIADRAGWSVNLCADPIPLDNEDPLSANVCSNPSIFHLVRWYMRFDFVPYGPSEDGFIMRRPSAQPRPIEMLLRNYETAKKSHDLTITEFDRRWGPSAKSTPAKSTPVRKYP